MTEAGLPTYVPDLPPEQPRRRQMATVVAFFVAASLVVAGGAVVLAGRPSGDASQQGPTTSAAATATGAAAPDNTVALPLGSPTDGLGTKMLPVRVTPDKGLVDGQVVTVTGSGFSPNVMIGGVMCTGAARTKGIAACDMTNIGYNVTTDAAGTFVLSFPVRRYPNIGGQFVDCASGNVDPQTYAALIAREGPRPAVADPRSATCIVAVGEVSNYDNSGGWPIAFEGATFLTGGPEAGAPAGGEATTTSGLQPATPPPTSPPSGPGVPALPPMLPGTVSVVPTSTRAAPETAPPRSLPPTTVLR